MSADTITFLVGEPGKRASKMWLADGTTADYDAGWRFQPTAVPVEGLPGLSYLLTQAQTVPGVLVVRGTFRGDAHAQTVWQKDDRTGEMVPGACGGGWYRRWKELFDDAPHHWICIDIDGYRPPAGIDPVLEPERAIYSFIEEHLPESFEGAGFHWQLSSSAGHAKNAGILKAHVWFWLTAPRTCAELTVWAPAAVDRTLYRVVQVHYTALPVFAEGVVDPVPRRCGMVPGHDVTLVIDPVRVEQAQVALVGSRDLLDPRTKSGVVGAFCRAYSIEQLLEGPLKGIFEYEGRSTKRLTWLQGGGAQGGAFITDDGLHICNTHNTSPVGATALNGFDLVRVYCFGDRDAGADPLALVEMRTRPSYRAMCDWAGRLPEVVAQMPARPPVTVEPAAAARMVDGDPFLNPEAQVQYFAGCCYVADLNRIMTRDGQFYDQQRFNALYGGRVFVMDRAGTRTVRNAWEAFLESQVVQQLKVNASMFRPELPPGHILECEGLTYVNSYVPIMTRQVEGDVGPFLRFVAKLLPNERDRKILLTYMASMLRNPGRKFQWWPVLQGTEGNGKTAFIRIMQHCVGHRYSHLPNVGDLAKNGIKFNSWIINTLFLGFEEIYAPGRRELLEELKPVVTNDSLQAEKKGVDALMVDNRANGMMCTNHLDGVPITVDTRRYAVFHTAQQCATDKTRDGMTGDYFPDFYDWLNGRGKYEDGGAGYGYAVINWYLRHQFEIAEEFDPSWACQTAPKTSTSDAAIKASYGPIEQEILEAIEQGEQGFRGGWVSSVAIDILLERSKKHLSRNLRRSMMQTLGYDWHPGLHDGRLGVNSIIDRGRKPVIYVKKGSPEAALISATEIYRNYTAAQTS